MGLSIDHHLHFKCTFTLVPKPGVSTKWSDVPYAIRRWIGNRVEARQGFHGPWYFLGGTWRPAGDKRFLVQSARHIGDGSETAPQYWSVRYEHADDQIPARQWRTDVGVTTSPDMSVSISLSTIHWIQPGFIGREPDPPVPSAPGIVSMLLRDPRWYAWAGTEQIVLGPRHVKEGKGDRFRDRLFDSGRTVPLVLVSKSFQSGTSLIDAARLARLLAGSAVVYESESSLVDKELDYLLDADYRCWNGRVQVYQPGIAPDRPGDSRRHRYFTPDEIVSLGANTVEDFLVRGIVRRSQLLHQVAVTTVEDIRSKIQAAHLEELRASAPGTKDWIEALEADNKRLSDELLASRNEAEAWLSEVERLQTMEEEVRVMEFRIRSANEEADRTKQRVAALEPQARVLSELDAFPASIPEVIGMVQRVFPGRLYFTDRALDDARKCKLRDSNVAWQCLRAMATELHRLHFVDGLPMREVVRQFENLVPFKLAATESETTRNNKRLAMQRRGLYKGQEREFNAHVKAGRDPGNTLRVHYLVDDEDNVLVIDRCVDHLDLMSFS